MKEINHRQRIFCKSIVAPNVLWFRLCSEISDRSFVDSNQEDLDINETLKMNISKRDTFVERNTE